MNSENSILIASFQDLFTSKMLKFSLLPFIFSIVLLYVTFFILAGVGVDSLGSMQVESSKSYILDGVPNTDTFHATLEGSALINFLMSHAITSWIATFLLYTVGMFITLYFSIFVALIIIGFLTPFILKELQKRHYSDVALVGHSNIFAFFLQTLKWLSLMLLMYLIFVPLYFVPLINIIAFNFPLYYFFHKMLHYDISSTICSKEEAMQIRFFHATTLRLKSLALYLLSLIPFVIFFASVFYVIYLGHAYFLETRKLREKV
jgi:hypothetical protein